MDVFRIKSLVYIRHRPRAPSARRRRSGGLLRESAKLSDTYNRLTFSLLDIQRHERSRALDGAGARRRDSPRRECRGRHCHRHQHDLLCARPPSHSRSALSLIALHRAQLLRSKDRAVGRMNNVLTRRQSALVLHFDLAHADLLTFRCRPAQSCASRSRRAP